jgi:hypothetical protein
MTQAQAKVQAKAAVPGAAGPAGARVNGAGEAAEGTGGPACAERAAAARALVSVVLSVTGKGHLLGYPRRAWRRAVQADGCGRRPRLGLVRLRLQSSVSGHAS